MFANNDMDNMIARLSELETGQVSDVLDEAGLSDHAIDSELRPLDSHAPFAGRAICVRGMSIVNGAHSPPALPADTLESVCEKSSVLFIDSGGFSSGAVIGGFVAYSLQREQCRGLITNGAIRDADEIRGYGFPCYARRVVPNNGARRWRLIERDSPVFMPSVTGGSVRVRPGDLVLADGDGIVVIPLEFSEQIIEDAEELARIERRIAEELQAGGSRADVFKRNPRFKHIRAAVSGEDMGS